MDHMHAVSHMAVLMPVNGSACFGLREPGPPLPPLQLLDGGEAAARQKLVAQRSAGPQQAPGVFRAQARLHSSLLSPFAGSYVPCSGPCWTILDYAGPERGTWLPVSGLALRSCNLTEIRARSMFLRKRHE